MASTGNVFPGTGESVLRGATGWTNPGNIVSDNATDATCNGPGSDYLVARNFNFSVIPAGAVIQGVTVRVEASEHSAGTEVLNAQLQDDSATLVGSAKSNITVSGTGKAVYTTGGTADTWGASLTRAIVQDADFGVRLWFTTSHDVRIDFVTMAIEYTGPFTGTSAVTVGRATLSGSATFTAPVYTGTSAVAAGPAVLSGSATFTAPVYTGTSALTVGAAALSASGTFAGGNTFTATAALTMGATTSTGTATFAAPVYTGTSSLTVGATTASGSATSADPVYTGTAALSASRATLAGSAAFTAPTYTGTSTLNVGKAVLSGSALFSASISLGTSALNVGAATFTATATFEAPAQPVHVPTQAGIVGVVRPSVRYRDKERPDLDALLDPVTIEVDSSVTIPVQFRAKVSVQNIRTVAPVEFVEEIRAELAILGLPQEYADEEAVAQW